VARTQHLGRVIDERGSGIRWRLNRRGHAYATSCVMEWDGGVPLLVKVEAPLGNPQVLL